MISSLRFVLYRTLALALGIAGCAVEARDDETASAALDAGGSGLTGHYFPNETLAGASVDRVDATVAFNWGTAAPLAGIAADQFSARWTGDVVPRFTELYTFTTTSDDGVRLTINGQRLVDNWTAHGPTANTGTIALTAGQRYAIVLEYFEHTGGAQLKLAWSSPSQAAEVVPASQLFPTSSAGPVSACLPFDPPSTAALRARPKKVFGFYYPLNPLSIDNKDASQDQYMKWLTPSLLGATEAAFGGPIRNRPFPRPVRTATSWQQLDFEVEIRRAIAMGLDGFIYEYPDHVSDNPRQNTLTIMLAAAQAADPGFRIVLSPDFALDQPGVPATPDGVAQMLLKVKDHPSILRLADGSIVLSSFAPERHPPAWWETLRTQLAASGVKIALFPLFGPTGANLPGGWNDHVIGYSTWGVRFASFSNNYRLEAIAAHNAGRLFMTPVAFQDARPREQKFWEPNNSDLLRTSFDAAIAGNADWAYLPTWNDYTESPMSPSVELGYMVADLVAYYTVWFKTGQPPAITHDALYYTHRNQRSDAPFDATKQTAGAFQRQGSDAVANNVELLAFLTAPGRLVIQQGADVRTMDALAGLTPFKVPLVAGTTPVFQLQRGGAVVQTVQSATPVRGQVVYQDLAYHAGGGRSCTRPQ